jgi:hypothetical protein
MKYTFRFLSSIISVMLFQSCLKTGAEPDVIIDPYVYAARYNWYEDSMQMGDGEWAKVEKPHIFSWLSQDNDFRKSNFAIYPNTDNIKTNFNYVIQKDSVLSIRLSSDTVYFIGADDRRRTDLIGLLTFSTDTLLTLHNTGVTPAISIKYKMKK